ncbi:GGDEF domain-containing protein [Candidatus Thiodiazotropha sp. CDECU1]|uniref:GGDEF domain-containing protein n=1 Tax=Candidatus Thiodiazotropha sp. CDECU1 TaxID=3065865 RepID=UPI002930FA3B|nr:GGDEF domain-containing protein [Candidatus Thiodiazotropha sp. CDECU1]
MNQPTEGLHKMGSTDHSKKGNCNLRLVKSDDQSVQTIRLPGRLDDVDKPDEMLQRRVDELEQQVRLLQQQLESERKLAQIDPLTGIANRRAFAARLKSEIARSERYATPLSLVVWDIDHFKKINDSYGHPFGDDVIRCVAQVIDTHLRESDFTARYGGEEFVALLPGCDADGARSLAEKISLAIQQSGCCLNIVGLNLTVSCGIASLHGPGRDETLFKRADDALYRAKVTGRNRVVVEDD